MGSVSDCEVGFVAGSDQEGGVSFGEVLKNVGADSGFDVLFGGFVGAPRD